MNKEILASKQQQQDELAKLIQGSKSIIIFEYLGLNAKLLTKLRRELHNVNATMYVAKNNIFNRAINSNNLQGFAEIVGPSAMVIANGDEIAPFKIISETIKDNPIVKYKDGLLESNHVSPSQLASIASIPGRNELYSMLLSCLQGNIRNLAYGLKAIAEAKQ